MISRKSILSMVSSIIVVCVCIIGCGVSQKQLDDAENRIKALEAKGVPDSLLTSAKVYLFQAKSAVKSANSAYAKRYADSLFYFLEIAEDKSGATLTQYKPIIDSLLKTINERKKKLTGMQLHYADSVYAILDSFVTKGWLIQARDKAIFLDTLFPRLLEDEKRANTIRPKLVGTWKTSRVPEGGYKALEKRQFTFKKDGTFTGSEEMKGQTSEYVKEDWKFLTWGTWKMRGDTVLMFVEREKCPRQVYHNYMKKDGRMRWVKNVSPTYDSTIVGHGKDRYMTYQYLLDFFKKR